MMKDNIAKVLTFSLLAASAGLISCVDNDRNFFDGEKMKQIYEETFPVKGVDPDGDWTMSRSVAAHVSVNGDWGVDYTVRIFDANPLVAENGAKLLAEGTAGQDKTFDVEMDCATALNTVFVARVDEHGRYLVQPVVIENNVVTAHFGDKATNTRVASRADVESSVPDMDIPYTAREIDAYKKGATEIQADWDLGTGYNWHEYANLPVFQQSVRWFKIPRDKPFTAALKTTGTSGGAEAVKVIIPSGSTWVIENGNQFDNITEVIVEDGGKIEITGSGTLTLTQASYVTVLPGGSIVGDGAIRFTNGSAGKSNYNAGIIDCSVLSIEGGGSGNEFYNYGLLKLDLYNASTGGTTLVNHGTIEAETIDGNNNTNIKNGCYIKTEKLQFGSLLMGNTSEIICEELTNNGNNNDIVMEAQSMLTCTEKASLYRNITGPTNGFALLRINEVENTSGLAYSPSKISNNIICEITDQTSKGVAQWEWSPFDWLVNKGLQNSATYCNPGKADFLLPADGECIKEGYTPDEEEDEVEIQNAVYSYAFEDNYPYAGDYDFNDIVLNVTMPAASDDVDELKYTIDLRAIGAIKQLGAGLRIKGIKKSNVEKVTFGKGASERTVSLNSGIFENAAYEKNDNELVIPLFGDAHAVYGYAGEQRTMLNTGNLSTPLTDIYTLEVTIELNDDISVPSATKDLDFFIAYKGIGNKRTEIHLSRFASATTNGQLANNDLLDIIKLVNNTWALCVPDKFAYPTETSVITDVYPGFAGWAQDQNSTSTWYTNPASSDKVIKY